jgi:hypothetical protein
MKEVREKYKNTLILPWVHLMLKSHPNPDEDPRAYLIDPKQTDRMSRSLGSSASRMN